MKVEIDVPEAISREVMRSSSGQIAIAVSANLLEVACDSLQKKVVDGDTTLEAWITQLRANIVVMRSELLA